MSRYVTLINRTSRPLKGVWDGRTYILEPGKNSYPEQQAVKFKEQNPVMGTGDPASLDREYLLGIEDLNDPIDPIEQSNAIEILDRRKLGGIASKAEIQPAFGGTYRVTNPLPADAGFVKA